MTTFFADGIRIGALDLHAEAAHHARVKRMEEGDEVSVTDGMGNIGTGRIDSVSKTSLRVYIDHVRELDPPPPIHLCVPVADKERMLWVAEKATELQVASWLPVIYERSKSVNPRGEGESFDRKVLARMMSALEQSGGAWLPAIHPIATVAEIAPEKGILFERDGMRFGNWAMTTPMTIAIGPEGGFTDPEFELLNDAGWSVASLGDVTLRFETAAIAAVAIARAQLP
jgi:16S rRNA (uracil1498-N3)-methyltransferase